MTSGSAGCKQALCRIKGARRLPDIRQLGRRMALRPLSVRSAMPRQDHPAYPNLAFAIGPSAHPPSAALPLQGLTILVVEDSRFACEALRLIAQRAGARLRRAENLETARAHLRTYRPDIAVVDLGLPDGRGEALIRDLVLARPRIAAIIGTSGLPTGRLSALAAGADGFLEKPIGGYRAFCELMARFLPGPVDLTHPSLSAPLPAPDPLALRDDLLRAAKTLGQEPDRALQRYVSNFVAGIARVSDDDTLVAASDAGADGPEGLARLLWAVNQRLDGVKTPLMTSGTRIG